MYARTMVACITDGPGKVFALATVHHHEARHQLETWWFEGWISRRVDLAVYDYRLSE